MHPRQVAFTVLHGFLALPLGIRMYERPVGFDGWPKRVEVSTACLEGGHLEDPLKICEPEHGFETMVFLDGCSFFSVYTAKYETREAAAAGHQEVVDKLQKGELKIAVPIGQYRVSLEPSEVAA